MLAAILAHGERRAEVHAGIPVAVPLAPQREPQVAADESQEGRYGMGARLPLAGMQQGAVLEHAVVIDAERHEDEIAIALDPEAARHVVEHAEAWRPHEAIARKPAFRKHRLRHA